MNETITTIQMIARTYEIDGSTVIFTGNDYETGEPLTLRSPAGIDTARITAIIQVDGAALVTIEA